MRSDLTKTHENKKMENKGKQAIDSLVEIIANMTYDMDLLEQQYSVVALAELIALKNALHILEDPHSEELRNNIK